MDWLFFALLGILWAAFLLPSGRERRSLTTSVEEFEKKMDLLAETGRQPPGAWRLAPKKGEPFIGTPQRERARARERRRRLFVVLLEAIGLTFLIGLFPPLRRMWFATAGLGVLLGLYVWVLLSYKRSDIAAHVPGRAASTTGGDATEAVAPVAGAMVGNGHGGNGRTSHADKVHVVVRLPEELEALRA